MLPKIFPVTCHTDHVGPRSTFVAIKGFKEDGTAYIHKALSLGATKIVVEEGTLFAKENKISEQMSRKNCEQQLEIIFVKNSRIALGELSASALENPASKLKIIGITGTKGKTTTTYFIEHILRQSGFKTALIGTIKNKILDQEIETFNTTPESDYLQMFFAGCVKKGVEFVVMEVSAHALSLHRVHNIKFDVVGFTNLASEHLDFYKDMEEYFQAKISIFDQVKKNGSIIINADNDWSKKALEILKQNGTFEKKQILSFGHEKLQVSNYSKNIGFTIDQNNLESLKFKIKVPDQKHAHQICSTNFFGEFNVYNLTMSFLICRQLGIALLKIKKAIETFSRVPGRLQIHTLKNGAKAFVDYAHNPSSMEAVLQTLRPLTKDLIVVFGCGGDRDKTKRPMMGKIASQNANRVIVTSDNPRTEKPEQILQDILTGINSKETETVFCELDRKKAIQKAAKLSTKDSVIALLGKGHENYFLIKGEKFHFDDFEEISRF